MNEIVVTDKRGKRDEGIVAPLVEKPKKLVKVTPKTIFIHPTSGRIIVQEDSFRYEGRLVIPEASKRRPTTGTILEIGKGVDDIFKVGQKIGYGLYSGTVMEFKGWIPEERIIFRILGQDEVLAIIDEKAPEFVGVGVGT
jgi:co-chaperonin GroES (HSP10)